ncbi:MAG: TetR/AcrR family transcriptional regulator [Sandaracinaceae bacterium]|nr:TetR/AcrR family transcriptional regulator [Sandaracinaceae bacterium]
MSREEQRERTRRRLYECALEVFRRDGVVACRIDDIATAAGVSRGSFYFHFPTKEHVLLERMRETEDVICDALDALGPDASVTAVLGVLNEQLAAVWEPDPQLLPDVTGAALRLAATTMEDREATRLRRVLAERFRAARGAARSKGGCPRDPERPLPRPRARGPARVVREPLALAAHGARHGHRAVLERRARAVSDALTRGRGSASSWPWSGSRPPCRGPW